MRKEEYCPICDQEHKREEKSREIEVTYRGEQVKYKETYYVCGEGDYLTGYQCNENTKRLRKAYEKLEDAREVALRVGNRKLRREQCLVEYNYHEIYYTCKDKSGRRYVVLEYREATGENKATVYELNTSDLVSMLKGEVSMRESHKKAKGIWLVTQGETVEEDKYKKKAYENLNPENEPKEGGYYKVLERSVSDYIRRLEKELRSNK